MRGARVPLVPAGRTHALEVEEEDRSTDPTLRASTRAAPVRVYARVCGRVRQIPRDAKYPDRVPDRKTLL